MKPLNRQPGSKALLAIGLFAIAATAAGARLAETANPVARADDVLATSLEKNPFEPVFVVTSRELYQKGVQLIARNGIGKRDSVGTDLVVAEIRAHQLPELSNFVHESENRCGGFFAFIPFGRGPYLRGTSRYCARR